MTKKLTILEENFIAAYLKTGNGKQSYLEIRPNVKPRTAESNACRLLRKAKVQDEIQRRLEKQNDNSQSIRSRILEKFEFLAGKAEQAGQINTAINGYREVARIQGMYGQNSDDDGYFRLIQQITNITFNAGVAGKKADVIDLTGEDN